MSEVTELLLQWNTGDQDVQAALIEHIYSELNAIAARQLRNERHVDLQPNALVHEAYCRLIDLNRVEWQNRAHFLAMSARIMRGAHRRSTQAQRGKAQWRHTSHFERRLPRIR